MLLQARGHTARIADEFRSFVSHDRGNVAITFAVAAVALIGAMGVAIDYARRTDIETRLQTAADAAVLRGAYAAAQNGNEAVNAAKGAFSANITDLGLGAVEPVVTISGGTVNLNVTVEMPTTLLHILGVSSTRIAVSSEALMSGAAGKPLEIAIALDNTGSMAADMGTLRNTASTFVEQIFAMDPSVKVSIVPYVAAVNPGVENLPESVIDVHGEAKWHASRLRSTYIGFTLPCGGTPPSQAGGPGEGYVGSSSGQDNGSLEVLDPPFRFGGLLHDLLGISAAHAHPAPMGANVTPNSIKPISGNWYKPKFPDQNLWPGIAAWDGMLAGYEHHEAFVPVGFQVLLPCELYNPQTISHLDLFDRIPGAKWKGCVEARAEPYDVNDTVPVAGNPDTLFVPYFWPDESDPFPGWGINYHNNFMDDGPPPPGWDHDNGWGRMYSILKYNGVTTGTIKEDGPDTMGPNKSCPDPMLALTGNKADVLNKIASLNHWENGGTISSEGLMWAWRALSPEPPFTQGGPWDQTEKVIVLMSDGLNSLVGQPDINWHFSDYGAYGYARAGRFNVHTFDFIEEKLNDRLKLACRNAKQRGIKIFTVLFRENNANAINLMKSCATQPDYAFRADDSDELAAAFSGIVSKLPPGSGLRLSR